MSRRSRRTQYQLQQKQRVHDRTSALIPHNAKIVVDEVDDAWGEAQPLAFNPQRREWVSQGQPKVTVVRSIRADPLGALKAQGVIDQTQYDAGLIWQWSYMRSELGPVKGIDPTLERVDGGRLNEPLSEQVKRAVVNLRKARIALGSHGERLVIDVLGKGRTLRQAADDFGLPSKTGREYIGRRFRECLDCLAVVFGCATPSNSQAAQHNNLTPPQ